VALTLGACGRKSGLDLPPSATAAPAGSEASGTGTQGQGKNAAALQQNLYNAGNPADRTQYAPKLPKKRIILDPILD
jgi:predicted small lipoprotein YifL